MPRMIERNYNQLKTMVTTAVLDELVCMDITPASRFFLAESDKETWHLREDFPCVMPPAPISWLEFDIPPVIQSSERQVVNHGGRSLAALIMTLEVPEEDREDFLAGDGLIAGFRYYLQKSKNTDGVVIMHDERPKGIQDAIDQGLQAKWIMFWQIFAEPITRRTVIPFINYGFYLDQNGQILKDLSVANLRMRYTVPEDVLRHGFADSLPFLFALSLTHCRNVEMVESDVPPAVRKKRERNGIPTIKFKQLVIRPVGKKKVGSNEDKMRQPAFQAKHFIRGHFKNFSEENPLFGKWSGRYFWHMHAKGDSQRGQIVKRYKVQPEEPT